MLLGIIGIPYTIPLCLYDVRMCKMTPFYGTGMVYGIGFTTLG